jgi:hypothetical protein
VRVGERIGHTSAANGIVKQSREVEACQPVGAAEVVENLGELPECPRAKFAAWRELDEVSVHPELDGNVDEEQIGVVRPRESPLL